MRVFRSAEEIVAAKGEELGTSEWLEITQQRVNEFADATSDHQWIHVDIERAKQGPFGGPVAHGYLTLSLLPKLNAETYKLEGVKMGINYGLNKVRFPSPVLVGSRVRAVTRLDDVTDVKEGIQLTITATIEIEGSDKPACVAESLSRVVF
ncbi:MaoC family dehydratase [Saccharopolyspora sp. HNM0983]|uniref:MaoC family dehydratase n=1 Tax=Saccharopolyspora montiporae TaxID=2781240 RepID=A0A929BB15_9PSEU|nr:MaoC family dehydratase [Saccharopolyspora sp. HNM0983]